MFTGIGFDIQLLSLKSAHSSSPVKESGHCLVEMEDGDGNSPYPSPFHHAVCNGERVRARWVHEPPSPWRKEALSHHYINSHSESYLGRASSTYSFFIFQISPRSPDFFRCHTCSPRKWLRLFILRLSLDSTHPRLSASTMVWQEPLRWDG